MKLPWQNCCSVKLVSFPFLIFSFPFPISHFLVPTFSSADFSYRMLLNRVGVMRLSSGATHQVHVKSVKSKPIVLPCSCRD